MPAQKFIIRAVRKRPRPRNSALKTAPELRQLRVGPCDHPRGEHGPYVPYGGRSGIDGGLDRSDLNGYWDDVKRFSFFMAFNSFNVNFAIIRIIDTLFSDSQLLN